MAVDEQRLLQALRNADAAGDMAAATRIAQIIQEQRSGAQVDPRKAYAEAAIAQYPGISEEEQRRNRAAEMTAADTGPLEAFLVGAGRGFYNIGRGLGLAEPADATEQAAYEALQKQRPYATTSGEIVGESAPFVIPGAGAGRIATLAPRAAAMAGIGAAQSGLSARGRGEDLQTQLVSGATGGAIAGGLELALPYIGRAAGALVRRVNGQPPRGALIDAAGRPTAELQDALAKAGVSYDDLAQSAMQELTAARAGTSPEQAARSALFASEQVPSTRGAITQDFGQQAVEARLAEAVADPAAAPFRSLQLRQSEAIKSRLDELVNKLGVPERTGESLKEALEGRKTLLKQQKSALYKQAATQAENLGVLPIVPDNIAAAIPDARTVRRISKIAPGQASALDDLMIEFGIKKPPENFIGEITPLSLDNFEDFRAGLNLIERSDTSGAIKVLSGPVKDALDAEADLMADAVEQSGAKGATDLIKTLKQARGIVRETKEEFSPQALTGKLINTQRDGFTPVIEASKVVPKLFARETPIEQVQKTLNNLSRAGDKGKQAIGDLQAAAVLNLVDEAFGASSRKIDGIQTFGPGAFQKAIDKIGRDKLNLLFSGNKEALTRINNIESIAKAIQPPAGAVPKGSASVILDLVNRIGLSRVPGIGPFMDVISTVKASGKTRREVEKALNAKPALIKMASSIDRDYPALASALGIAGISQAKGEED